MGILDIFGGKKKGKPQTNAEFHNAVVGGQGLFSNRNHSDQNKLISLSQDKLSKAGSKAEYFAGLKYAFEKGVPFSRITESRTKQKQWFIEFCKEKGLTTVSPSEISILRVTGFKK